MKSSALCAVPAILAKRQIGSFLSPFGTFSERMRCSTLGLLSEESAERQLLSTDFVHLMSRAIGRRTRLRIQFYTPNRFSSLAHVRTLATQSGHMRR
jgi:hypothetical protein